MTETGQLLFNGAIETALRAVVLLYEQDPGPMSLEEMVTLDYLLVHSADFEGGPPSLHPATPLRGSAVLVRRELLTDGLRLLIGRGLAERVGTESGIAFRVTERAAWFVESLETDYANELRARSRWLSNLTTELGIRQLAEEVHSNISVWGAEFELEALLAEDEVNV